MKNNDDMISKLYTFLSEELKKREPYLKPCTIRAGDRQRQSLTPTNARYFIAITKNHIMAHRGSAVFITELLEDSCTLLLYVPLQQQEYERLDALNYAPILRSNVHLTVGLGKSSDISYAYAAIKISQSSSVADFFDAQLLIGHELERYLSQF